MSTSDSNCKDGTSKSSGDDSVCDVSDTLQNMSTADIVSVCANCGKGEEESGKLKSCTACKMVKYCNRECQIAHRPMHKKECKKRAAELHDEELFKQPPQEDCPICFVRLPLVHTGRRYYACCGKTLCSGCVYAPLYDDQGNLVVERKCPFCRTPHPTSNEELIKRVQKRIESNDPIAIYNMGEFYGDGEYGFPQDHSKRLELLHQAGELGYADAYNNIGNAYAKGIGVERDRKKASHYCELAAMKGGTSARHNLGLVEEDSRNWKRALKHYMIASSCGLSGSLDRIQLLYSKGHASKEDYMKALHLYQAYLGEIKSDQRDEAASVHEGNRYH